MANHPDVVLDARAPYGPRIVRSDGQLSFEMYVASGHADRVEILPIAEEHARVLCEDTERYWFLFTALHHPYQLTTTRPSRDRLADHLDAIFLAEPTVVDAILTDLDHGPANGASSNLLRIFVRADYDRMRSGRWFGSIPSQ